MKPVVRKSYLTFYEETARNRVLEVLFTFPEKEFSLSDLAKKARVAKGYLGQVLQELHSAKIITIIKLSKIWRIKANLENWFFIRSKIVYNLNFVYQSGLVEFLADYFNNPKAIILFGSFRNGEDLSASDIDIAIETDEAEGHKIIALRELSEFEKIIQRKINIHLFNRKKIPIELFNNIANGIRLSGFLEVRQ